MQEQGWGQQPCNNAGPVDFQVKRIELSAELERVQDEGNQAEHIEMDGPRGVPSPDEYEQTNEEIQESDEAQVIFHPQRFLGGGGNEPGFKLFAVPRQLIAKLR